MDLRTLTTVVLLPLLSACGGDEAPATETQGPTTPTPSEQAGEAPTAQTGCPPAHITVNGEETSLTHTLATSSADGAISILLFNDPGIGCEDALRGYWNNSPNLIQVIVRSKGQDGWVSVGNRTQMAEVRRLGELGAVGSPVAFCVESEVAFLRGVGKPPATVVGRVEGDYCGEQRLP